MKTDDFTYTLPEEAIALHPPKVRGSTKLLVLDRSTSILTDSKYADLLDFLVPGDLLVINNTKVLPARLSAQTETGADRELLLLEKHGKTVDTHSSLVMYRRKLRVGQTLEVGSTRITVDEVFDNGTARISSTTDLWELAEKVGAVPLPPYLHREADAADTERYQTVFANSLGSVAAPTASLNLTQDLMEELKAKGVSIAEVTLHVGLGTFMPIRVDDVTKHTMHQEYFEIPKSVIEAIQQTKGKGGRVIAVGTTVTRTLEYAADMLTQEPQDRQGEADIFIYPGYEFKVVDVMLTNFHAPNSTVLMMAAAFAGWENLKAAYDHALAHDYQFLSYGDSMLLV